MAHSEPTHAANPASNALNDMLQTRAARPKDIYRLAVILESVLESLDSPTALKTIRQELRTLIYDLSQNVIE
jgi:transketolase